LHNYPVEVRVGSLSEVGLAADEFRLTPESSHTAGEPACPKSAISARSGGWMPPPECRNTEASDQGDYMEADLYPVPDRGGISMRNPARRVEKQPVQKITAAVIHDFSLDKAIPYSAVAIDAQIDRDDASDNFIKEKLHADIHSSSH
jgi:hypothetical protein